MAALAGVFLNRVGIGIVTGGASLPLPGRAQGPAFGLLLSLPDAILSKAYGPIFTRGRPVA
jgi:hypothetical protein